MTTLSFLAAASSSQGGSGLTLLLPLVLMGVFFYFFLMRPQRQQRARQQQLLNELEVGDEVLTAGGMYGTIAEIDDEDDTILVEVAPGTRIRMLRRAVSQRLTEDEDHDDEDDTAADDEAPGEEAEQRP
ncbi:MAG: preprotein translocase subunit YajC [Actinomycetota bacterium]